MPYIRFTLEACKKQTWLKQNIKVSKQIQNAYSPLHSENTIFISPVYLAEISICMA